MHGTQTIVAGLSNDYSGYVTTYEEYLRVDEKPYGFVGQSYEAASTQFGAFTLAAYQTKFAELAQALVNNTTVTTLPMPRTSGDNLAMGLKFIGDDVLAGGDPSFDDKPPSQLSNAHEVWARATPIGRKVGGGCPNGGFPDPSTDFCWTCPPGFDRWTTPITENTACRHYYDPNTVAVNFGDLVWDNDTIWLQPDYARVFHRNDVVSVTFWGAHPKNVFGKKSFRFLDQFPSTPVPTFLSVQRDTGGGNWQTIRTDADWDTTFQWEHDGWRTRRSP